MSRLERDSGANDQSGFRFDRWAIGPGNPCMIIGEVGLAHDGSLGLAHAFIDAIADAGADAVKFQAHIADAESTPAEPWRVAFSRQDESRYDYWKRTEFTERQWAGLKEHADQRGLLFLCSPFSTQAVAMLAGIGVKAWKWPSGELGNLALVDQAIDDAIPIFISTGMSPWEEIDEVVSRLKERDVPVAVMQCTSNYPCPPESVGLNLLDDLRRRYGCPVGLSDHSGTVYPGLAAAALGVDLLEVHVALSREMFGPDVSSSVTTGELRQLVEGVRLIERMRLNPVDKDRMAETLKPMRDLFTKSVVARVDLPAGQALSEEHLDVRKPGTGIPAAKLSEVVGRRLRRPVKAKELIGFDDLV